MEDSSEHLSIFFRIAQIAHFVGDNSMHPNHPDFLPSTILVSKESAGYAETSGADAFSRCCSLIEWTFYHVAVAPGWCISCKSQRDYISFKINLETVDIFNFFNASVAILGKIMIVVHHGIDQSGGGGGGKWSMMGDDVCRRLKGRLFDINTPTWHPPWTMDFWAMHLGFCTENTGWFTNAMNDKLIVYYIVWILYKFYTSICFFHFLVVFWLFDMLFIDMILRYIVLIWSIGSPAWEYRTSSK